MAAGNTYTPIATQTLGTAAATVTFSSISGAYTDLVIIVNCASTTGSDLQYRFNSDTASNYSGTVLYGTGSAAGSTRQSNSTYQWGDYYGTIFTTLGDSVQTINIMNYANTTTYKTSLVRSNRASGGTDAIVGLWRSTAAITSIDLIAYGTTFKTGSTFTLYGIAAA